MSGSNQQQHIARLRTYLRQAGLRPGDRLPGEREIAAELGLGRTALRSAMDVLEQEGVLERRPQSGTFLAAIPVPSGQGAKVAVIAPFAGNNGASRLVEATWLHRVISAFERTAVPAGVQVILQDQSPRIDDRCAIKDMAREAIAQGVRAAILIHVAGTKSEIAHALTLLYNAQVHPLIVSARFYPGLASQVYFDSGWGAYHATWHLIQNGHRRIGFAGGPGGHEWVQERLASYRQALEAAEIEPDDAWVWLPIDTGERLPQPEDGAAAFRSWQALDAQIRPTAIFAANDVIAQGVLDAAAAAGVSVPDELSVIGFDNDPGALLAGLTTIERPTEALGEALARVLLDRLAAGTEADSVTVRLRPVLIERRTVGPPSRSLKTEEHTL